MLNEIMSNKLHEWFGSDCQFHVLKKEEGCAMVWVKDESNYSLARLIQFDDKADISVDVQINELDFNAVGSLMRRCIELM